MDSETVPTALPLPLPLPRLELPEPGQEGLYLPSVELGHWAAASATQSSATSSLSRLPDSSPG